MNSWGQNLDFSTVTKWFIQEVQGRTYWRTQINKRRSGRARPICQRKGPPSEQWKCSVNIPKNWNLNHIMMYLPMKKMDITVYTHVKNCFQCHVGNPNRDGHPNMLLSMRSQCSNVQVPIGCWTNNHPLYVSCIYHTSKLIWAFPYHSHIWGCVRNHVIRLFKQQVSMWLHGSHIHFYIPN